MNMYHISIVGTGNALNNVIYANNFDNSLYGLDGNDTLKAHGGNDYISGGTGNDYIEGGAGNDILVGGVGADRFGFNSRTDGKDTILDFSTVDDTIWASASGLGGGLVANTTLAASQFVLGAAARDASDRFIYNSANGALFYDLDGTGASAQIQIATLSSRPTLTNADIFISA